MMDRQTKQFLSITFKRATQKIKITKVTTSIKQVHKAVLLLLNNSHCCCIYKSYIVKSLNVKGTYTELHFLISNIPIGVNPLSIYTTFLALANLIH